MRKETLKFKCYKPKWRWAGSVRPPAECPAACLRALRGRPHQAHIARSRCGARRASESTGAAGSSSQFASCVPRCQVRRIGAAHRLCRPPQRLSSLQNGSRSRSRRHICRQVLRSQLLARRHPCLPVALPSDCRRFKMVEGHDCPRRHIRRLEAMLPAEGDAVPSRLAQ